MPAGNGKKGEKNYDFFFFLLKYEIMAFLFTLIAFVFVAAVFIFILIPSKVLSIISLAVSVIVLIIVSAKAGKDSGSVITGGMVALIFAAIRAFLAIVFGMVPLLSVRTPFEIITGFLIGVIGGIIGAGNNLGRRRYR